ncbi:hypothetical protein [Anabaena catenula]|uniref:Restriction endonuclease type IV Mrr domain-containing protein n=1 Tax=Anabaena catenula FACHB-362 TaxID=2692877 RepID=A0ABR8J564_9NOST|nr:hypothetical protein [Anabaena catenula]MBD2692171.1 hypothetical protein [Anabaena catenula FACHB-362]
MKLTMSAISKYSFEELYEIMAKNKLETILQIKVGDYYTSNLDWADAYLWALFVGESIVEYCEFITADSEGDYINFTFKPQDLVKLINKLKWFTLSYEENSTQYLEFENIYDNFKDSLEKRKLYFPDIADSYLGNIMLGMCDLGDEAIQKLYTEHPELKHDFFRSSASNNIGYDFYVSESSWIVPLNQNVQELLKQYGGLKNKLHNFEEAYFLSVINIEFHTPGRLGKPSVKWIAQCKLIRNGSSLSASKVQNITDVLVQYEAKGFCIMTSGIIDSTLYDKLDAIKKEMGIEIDDWCNLKIERFLANHPVIRNRYFQI